MIDEPYSTFPREGATWQSKAVQAQAGIMSYLDIFWMLGMLGLLVWPIALFLPRMPEGAAPAH
jgi:hypothetical protein